MKQYVCPMHPEIRRQQPGNCPKCGMKLVVEGSATTSLENPQYSYMPLLLILLLLFLASLSISFASGFSLRSTITNFMIGFFLVFSGFKLMDIKGFAQGYSTYDLLAKKVFAYGYVYPFIELFFAFAMIFAFQIKIILLLEIVVMVLSGFGVAIKLWKKEKFQCACLGTFLKVPLTKVTLVEDFGMALLAGVLLLL